jgi:hypothetical protein
MDDEEVQKRVDDSLIELFEKWDTKDLGLPPGFVFRTEIVVTKADGREPKIDLINPRIVREKKKKEVIDRPLTDEEWTVILAMRWSRRPRLIIQILKENGNDVTMEKMMEVCPEFGYPDPGRINQQFKILGFSFVFRSPVSHAKEKTNRIYPFIA